MAFVAVNQRLRQAVPFIQTRAAPSSWILLPPKQGHLFSIVCVCVCTPRYTCVHVHAEARGQPQVSSLKSYHLRFCSFGFWFLELNEWTRLAGWHALGIYLSLPPWHWAFKHLPLSPTEKKIATTKSPSPKDSDFWRPKFLPQCPATAVTGSEGSRAASLGMPVFFPLRHEELNPHPRHPHRKAKQRCWPPKQIGRKRRNGRCYMA